MNGQRHIRPALILGGLALGGATLLGARSLTARPDAPSDPSPSSAPSLVQKVGGPIVLGTVDSDPPPVAYGLPPVLQSGTVAEVFVRDGQEVRAGDRLYRFDTTLQTRDLERAQTAVELARTKVAEAQEAVRQHAKKVELQRQAVELARTKADLAARQYNLIRNNILLLYRAEKYPESTWEDRLKDEPKLFEAQSQWNLAARDVELKKAEQAALEAAEESVRVLLRQAEAGVKQAEAEVAKARSAIELCTVTAKTDGTIEQLTISPGSTLGVSSRTPALWLIPGGRRVVRGEVEADFAHRVTPDLIGREVVVHDHTDPKITYRGVVRRIGGTFLPKRTSGDSPLAANETRVLEVVVEVTDPAPPGLPPLRVGQRVRVNLGP